MENREEFLSEILKLQQKNYMQIVEIEKLTKEIGDVLSRSDRESVQILLGLRREEMDKADETKRAVQVLLQAADVQTREEVRGLLNGNSSSQPEDFESRKIVELGGHIRKILANTVEIDKVVSRKLAGADSYYKKTK